MSAARVPHNLAASVRQRLLDRARARGEDFQLLLDRYAVERFLYRLSGRGMTHASVSSRRSSTPTAWSSDSASGR